MAKAKKPTVADDSDDYQAQSDADTLTRAAEIQGDDDRHQRASKHLEKKAASTGQAHKTARKALEKKTKKRMASAFGGAGAGAGSQTASKPEGDGNDAGY